MVNSQKLSRQPRVVAKPTPTYETGTTESSRRGTVSLRQAVEIACSGTEHRNLPGSSKIIQKYVGRGWHFIPNNYCDRQGATGRWPFRSKHDARLRFR